MVRLLGSSLRLEILEDRATPAVFGEPWLDGRHLTLSFAGDGPSISGVGSNLSSTLSALGSESAKLEILRAFQSWAINANLNLGLVADSNWAFGSAGAIQGDPRFGDMRVGAHTLAGDVVAITAPFSLLTTTSGDFILNSGKSFAIGYVEGKYDLFTVSLQEAGHAFGIGNGAEYSSAMYEQYNGVRTGLSAADVDSIQNMYGTRTGDGFDANGENGTMASATNYAGALEADLTSVQDVDMYRYTATSSAGQWFRIKTAGISLATPRLEVLNAAGQVVGSLQSTNPLQNDLTVHIPALVSGSTYYIRVSSARSDEFGVGAYRLQVDSTEASSPAANPYALIDTETSANNTQATATTLAASSGPYDYRFRSTLSAGSDVDHFRIHSPASNAAKLRVTVSAVGESWFTPNVDVYSSAGVKLTHTVVAQTDSSIVITLEGTAANTDYVIRIASTFREAGNYDVVADFRASSLPVMMGATGTLDDAHRSTSATLNVWQSQTLQLNLLANLQNGADMVGLVRIYNAQNHVVFQLFSLTGILSTGQVFLARGQYKIEVSSLTGSAINFSFSMFGVTDPIGTSPTDPTGDPPDGGSGVPLLPPPPDPTTTVVIVPPPPPPPLAPPLAPPIMWF